MIFRLRLRIGGPTTPCQEPRSYRGLGINVGKGQIGEQHPAFVAEPNLMAIINGLIVAVFLILVTASVAVVGSMIVLTLFDLALSRKRPSGTTAVIDSDPEITNRSNLELALGNWRRERGGEAASGNNPNVAANLRFLRLPDTDAKSRATKIGALFPQKPHCGRFGR